MSRDIVLEYWKIIRYKTLIIQCVPEGTPIKRFCYESSVGKPCAFTGKACSDFKCVDRAVSIVAITSGLQPENRVSITLRSTIFCRLGFYTERVL